VWFRRRNKSDSDQSVLSTTLASLQGLLDERAQEAGESPRREPTLAKAESGDDAADAGAPAAGTPASASRWNDLDLEFDEVSTTQALRTNVVKEPDPAPVNSAATDLLDDAGAPETELQEIEIQADTPTEPDPADTNALFDAIPTLNEIVFDPGHNPPNQVQDAEPEAEPDLESEVESVMQSDAPAVEDLDIEDAEELVLESAEDTELIEVEEFQATEDFAEPYDTPEPEPSVITPGVKHGTTQPASPARAKDVAIELPAPPVPLDPEEFTEHLIRYVGADLRTLTGNSVYPQVEEILREALRTSLEDWIAEVQKALQDDQ